MVVTSEGFSSLEFSDDYGTATTTTLTTSGSDLFSMIDWNDVRITYSKGFICNVTTKEGVIPKQLLTIEEIEECRRRGYHVIVEPDQ